MWLTRVFETLNRSPQALFYRQTDTYADVPLQVAPAAVWLALGIVWKP
jgi:hypothetical protein